MDGEWVGREGVHILGMAKILDRIIQNSLLSSQPYHLVASFFSLLFLFEVMARGPKKPVAAKANRSKSAFSAGSQQRLPSSSASVAGFNDESDIPMDDQDLFHKQRDEILLGGNDEVDDQADEGELKGKPEGGWAV